MAKSLGGETATPTVITAFWLRSEGLRAVMAALSATGATPRFVGGCVRNALLDGPPTDLDIAVDIAPDETIRLLEGAGLRAIPTGLEHGTVTTLACLDDEGDAAAEPIEITSLRRDVETDGRRAVVAFTTDWAEDAQRRDFTMNALYADADGRVFDPLGEGLADLQARRVRFIGAAEDRIREDYLRILRFYRFSAWYGRGRLEPADVAATGRLVAGIATLAHERIGAEMKKLLAAPAPAASVRLMAETGVLEAALPMLGDSAPEAAERVAALERLENENGRASSWERRLYAIASARPERETPRETLFADHLRLSNAERAGLKARFQAEAFPPHEAGYRCGRAPATDAVVLALALSPVAPSQEEVERRLTAVDAGAAATFPLAARDLIAAGARPGPSLGAALKAAEENWIRHNFALDRATLLEDALKKV